MFTQVRYSFLLSLHCCAGAKQFFSLLIWFAQVLHTYVRTCIVAQFTGATLYGFLGPAMIAQLHRCLQTLYFLLRYYTAYCECSNVCSGASQPSSGPALFAPVLLSFLQGLHCTSMHTQVQDSYLQNLHCLLLCYTAFLGPASFDQMLHSFLQG